MYTCIVYICNIHNLQSFAQAISKRMSFPHSDMENYQGNSHQKCQQHILSNNRVNSFGCTGGWMVKVSYRVDYHWPKILLYKVVFFFCLQQRISLTTEPRWFSFTVKQYVSMGDGNFFPSLFKFKNRAKSEVLTPSPFPHLPIEVIQDRSRKY